MCHTSVKLNWSHTYSFCTQSATGICTALKDLWVWRWFGTKLQKTMASEVQTQQSLGKGVLARRRWLRIKTVALQYWWWIYQVSVVTGVGDQKEKFCGRKNILTGLEESLKTWHSCADTFFTGLLVIAKNHSPKFPERLQISTSIIFDTTYLPELKFAFALSSRSKKSQVLERFLQIFVPRIVFNDKCKLK